MRISPDLDREGSVTNLQLSLEGVFIGRMNTLDLVAGLVSDKVRLLERDSYALAIKRDGGGSASITFTNNEGISVYKVECIEQMLDTLLNRGKAVTLHHQIL